MAGSTEDEAGEVWAHGTTAFMYAAAAGPDAVRLLIDVEEAGADAPCLARVLRFNAQDATGRTALMRTVLANPGNVAFVAALPGIDANLEDAEGMTALMHAVDANNADAVRGLFFCKTLDVNRPDRRGETPLVRAVRGRRKFAAAALLGHKDVDLAVAAADPGAARLLAALRARRNARAKNKKSDSH